MADDKLTSFYKTLSTETLEQILRDMTLSENELDLEQLDCILAELSSREGAPSTLAPEAALKIFEETYSGNESVYLDCAYEEKNQQTSTAETKPSRRKHSWNRIILVAATVSAIMIGSLLMAQAAGANIFGTVASWTSTQLGFGEKMADAEAEERTANQATVWPPEADEDLGSSFDYASDTDCLALYGTFQALMDAYHVAPEIDAPKYIPEGFRLVGLRRCPFYPWMQFFARYENDSGECFFIEFTSYDTDPATVYEKTEDPVQIVEIEDHAFHAFSNEANETVAWVTTHYDCSVMGTISQDELLKIAESIYFEVD
jgi:hypothetical protein